MLPLHFKARQSQTLILSEATHGSTVTLTVTVASKDATHRYNGSGSANGYKIDGKFAPFITLTPGRTYRFDQADSSNSNHPLDSISRQIKLVEHYDTGVATNSVPVMLEHIQRLQSLILHQQFFTISVRHMP
ncbi:MAG: hypothetical protein CM15mV26_1230 [uncultured marine virus]|nr:MAG: hypothetical protein CM15mV26_1230 [uncultured marine virus]